MMMSGSNRVLVRSYGTLIGRVCMGLLFFFSGIMMAKYGIGQISAMIAGFGFPAAVALAWLIVVVKVVGGASLIVGYRVGCASAALIAFTLLTIGFVHRDFMNDINFFKNLAIIGGLLYVIAYGPGEGWSLTRHLEKAKSASSSNPSVV